MKKRILALVAVMAVLFSMLMLTSCPNKPDGDLNLDESFDENRGSGDVYIIGDPTDPEAGADAEENYIGDHK